MRFSEIPGKHELKNELISGVKNRKLSHSILFAGKEGHGGLPLALALATYINCENPGEHDSCGECLSCRKADKHIHPDIHFTFSTFSDSGGKQVSCSKLLPQWRTAILENPYLTDFDWLSYVNSGNKQGYIHIEECHQIIRNISLTTYENKAKIQIIWGAQNLGANANSLLKIIEEPTPSTYFFFIASEINSILPTILSRTRIYLVPPFTIDEIKVELQKRNQENLKIESIALRCGGDMNEAISLIKSEEPEYFENMRSWLNYSYFMNRLEIYKIISKLSEFGREKTKDFLQYILGIFRESIIYKFNSSLLKQMTEKEVDFIKKLSVQLDENSIYLINEEINQAIYHVERNANLKFIYFHLSLQFYRYIGEGKRIKTRV